MKHCQICGKEIKDKEFYYRGGPNIYICGNGDCFDIYFWNNITARITVDKNHEYVIINKNVYEVGSDNDMPRGFGGRHWIIQFKDGVRVETNSLWHRGTLPKHFWSNFKDNAEFVKE